MMNIAKYSLENTKVVYFFLAILLVGGVLSFEQQKKKERIDHQSLFDIERNRIGEQRAYGRIVCYP